MSTLLTRTINQPDVKLVNDEVVVVGSIRFWRIASPEHPQFGSDLSVEGLKEWGVIR